MLLEEETNIQEEVHKNRNFLLKKDNTYTGAQRSQLATQSTSFIINKNGKKVYLLSIIETHILIPYRDDPKWRIQGIDGDNNSKIRLIKLYSCFNYFIKNKYPKSLTSILSRFQIETGYRELLITIIKCQHVYSSLLSFNYPLRASLLLFFNLVSNLTTEEIKQSEFINENQKKEIREIFQSEYIKINRNSNKQIKSIETLITSIYERHAKVLVLRLDLSYKKVDHSCGIYSNNSQDIAGIGDHNAQFLKHLRKVFPDTLLGYIWRLEYAEKTGYHLHYLILLNGQKHHQDILITQRLATEWIDVITAGQGRAWNCNASKKDYKNLAIGMSTYDSPKEGMNALIKYFSKKDMFFNTYTGIFDEYKNVKRKFRTLGMSHAIKKITSTKVFGRPRKKKITMPYQEKSSNFKINANN